MEDNERDVHFVPTKALYNSVIEQMFGIEMQNRLCELEK